MILPRFEHALSADTGRKIGWPSTIGLIILVIAVWFGSLAAMAFAQVFGGFAISGGAVPGVRGEMGLALIVVAGGFGLALLTLILIRTLIERRPLAGLFTGAARFRWGMMLTVFAVMLAFTGTAVWMGDEGMRATALDRLASYGPEAFAMVLGAYALGFAIQSTFEEVFLRGWLLQRLCAHGLNVWLGALATSLAFAGLHIAPGIGPTYLIAVVVMALTFAWSVIRLNGLEFAIGAHIANNLVVGGLFAGLATGSGYQEQDMVVASALGYFLVVGGFVEFLARFWPGRGGLPALPAPPFAASRPAV